MCQKTLWVVGRAPLSEWGRQKRGVSQGERKKEEFDYQSHGAKIDKESIRSMSRIFYSLLTPKKMCVTRKNSASKLPLSVRNFGRQKRDASGWLRDRKNGNKFKKIKWVEQYDKERQQKIFFLIKNIVLDQNFQNFWRYFQKIWNFGKKFQTFAKHFKLLQNILNFCKQFQTFAKNSKF